MPSFHLNLLIKIPTFKVYINEYNLKIFELKYLIKILIEKYLIIVKKSYIILI